MKAPIPQEEENMICEYIYKLCLVEILEKDLKVIAVAGFKIPDVYSHYVDYQLRRIRIDIRDTKIKFRKMNIKVMDPVKVNVDFIEYEYFAHGYQGKLRYWQYALAQHVNRRMKIYFYCK